jgi:hypothetical protein
MAITNIGTLPAQDEYIITTLGLSSIYDRMLCLVLNERSRELCGEFIRWQDLARTQTLAKRVQTFNLEGGPNVKPHHSLRPIPQTFLDGVQANGAALTGAEKQAMQNPGY